MKVACDICEKIEDEYESSKWLHVNTGCSKFLLCDKCEDKFWNLFEKDDNEFFNFEGAWELEKQKIRKDTIEEMTQTIREIGADTTNCLFDCPKADEPITCTICVLERAVEQMKGVE